MYRFIHQHEQESANTYETSHVLCTEIVEDFRLFLLGCGFSEDNITEAFASYDTEEAKEK